MDIACSSKKSLWGSPDEVEYYCLIDRKVLKIVRSGATKLSDTSESTCFLCVVAISLSHLEYGCFFRRGNFSNGCQSIFLELV